MSISAIIKKVINLNIIFLDFDGVLDTYQNVSYKDIDKKIKILSKITNLYKCKVVIEASSKSSIDEDTKEISSDFVKHILDKFKEYNIEYIGKTPSIRVYYNNYSYQDLWKEDEIRIYLLRHPEIEHFCIIDDNDYTDLTKLYSYLVTTKMFGKTKDDEGLTEDNILEIANILKKENIYKEDDNEAVHDIHLLNTIIMEDDIERFQDILLKLIPELSIINKDKLNKLIDQLNQLPKSFDQRIKLILNNLEKESINKFINRYNLKEKKVIKL